MSNYTLIIIQKCKSTIGPLQVGHLRPQTPQGESVAKSETHLLIVLSLVCKYGIKEIHGNYSNPGFSKKVQGQKQSWEIDKCRESSPYIALSKYWHPVEDNQCWKGQATIGHPFPHQLNIWIQISTHCLSHRFQCWSFLFNILGIEWDRNIIISVIAAHLSHAQGRWLVYFSFASWKSDQMAMWLLQLHTIVSTAWLIRAWNLSCHHLLTHAIIPIISIGLKKKWKCWFV